MDSNQHSQVCPWCHTEIVWDPELGPEESCPHCLNELKGYRTVKLKLMQNGEDLSLEEDDELDDEESEDTGSDDDFDFEDSLDDEDLLDDYTVEAEPDPFAAKVLAVMDSQDLAPECSNCHELMLLAGTRKVEASAFTPRTPDVLGTPFLTGGYTTDVFVCPSCFKTDEYLNKPNQESMMKAFGVDQD